MRFVSKGPKALFLMAALALPVSGTAYAQEDGEVLTTVYGTTEGPRIEGIISAHSGDKFQITGNDGSRTIVTVDDQTRIKSSGGFLGMNSNKHSTDSLMNGLPVTVETVRYRGGLLASEVKLKGKDLKTAAMIRNGTSQRFAEHDAAIDKNAKLAESLRGRMGDIDKYNIKGTTNVYFASGKWMLTPEAESNLCAAAAEADGMDNALLLVVGYTDSTGSYEVNQALSEKRAGRVVNYLQQACGWKPWRMLSPTGMAQADPLASNDTPEGKAQNRRVAVNILVSKAVDEL